MSLHQKLNGVQASYQVVLYGRALHPEHFTLKSRRVVRHGSYELEAWVLQGSHVLRFEHQTVCAAELVTDQDQGLPDKGVVAAFLCAGEHDFEHRFDRDRVMYMTTVQTESLSENLYNATFDEIKRCARGPDSIVHEWDDDSGRCLSVIEFQRYSKEVHVQAYHMHATGGLVLRTQTLFEHA